MPKSSILIIGSGGHAKSIIDLLQTNDQYEILGLIGKPENIDKEILGYKIITALLDAFVSAASNTFLNQDNSYDKLLLELIPEHEELPAQNLYQTLLNASCYVASLTDGKAMLLAEKIGFK